MHYNLVSSLAADSRVDLQDRGLHYGDGLFETMLLSEGHILYWEEHYDRLLVSARRLHMGCPDKAWFERNLQAYLALNEPLIIKIILTRGSGGRGLQLPDEFVNNVYLLHYPVDISGFNQPVVACFSAISLPQNKNLAGLKHLNRLDYVLASDDLKSRKGFNEALLFNTAGFAVESIINNLFFVKDGIVCTPTLDNAGVNGVMRLLILKVLKRMQKEVKIGDFTRQDILAADEIFLCNSVQGLRPVIQLEDAVFSIGSLTTNLQQEFNGHSGN